MLWLPSCSLFWITTSGGSKLPYFKDAQAALWRVPHGEELRPPGTQASCQKPAMTCQACEWAFLEADPPVPVKPAND